jgi:hypothetical protein
LDKGPGKPVNYLDLEKACLLIENKEEGERKEDVF